jgi:hypothetical protein
MTAADNSLADIGVVILFGRRIFVLLFFNDADFSRRSELFTDASSALKETTCA